MILGLVSQNVLVLVGTERRGAGGIDVLKVKGALRCFARSGQIMQ